MDQMLAVKMRHYLAGTQFGVIMITTGIIAPIISKNLDKNSFRKVIRKIWPRFYYTMTTLSVAQLTALYFEGVALTPSNYHTAIAGGSAIVAVFCNLAIPKMNAASDKNDHRTFSILHKVTVGGTFAVLLAQMAAPFL